MSEPIQVFVDSTGEPGENGERSKDGTCPKCGAKSVGGFGFAYGGYGPYEFCDTEGCGWFWKIVLPPDAE